MMPDVNWFKQTYPQFTDDPEDNRWKDEHWTDDAGVEFRYYGEWLDEIVGRNVNVHFECMDTGSWWMSIRTPDGHEFTVNLGVKRTKPKGEQRDEKWVEKNLTNWAFHEQEE